MFRSILLLEDDQISSFLTKRLLVKEGFCSNIQIIHQGDKFLSFLQEKASSGSELPDLLMMDMNVPEFTGTELVQKIRLSEYLNKLPIIILSNTVRESERSELTKLGIQSILIKPLSKEKFLSAIAEIQT